MEYMTDEGNRLPIQNPKFKTQKLHHNVICILLVVFGLHSNPAHGFDFHIEKQKLKVALEYENFVGTQGSQLLTPGLRTTYSLRASAEAASRLFLNFDLQSGAKINASTHFD